MARKKNTTKKDTKKVLTASPEEVLVAMADGDEIITEQADVVVEIPKTVQAVVEAPAKAVVTAPVESPVPVVDRDQRPVRVLCLKDGRPNIGNQRFIITDGKATTLPLHAAVYLQERSIVRIIPE